MARYRPLSPLFCKTPTLTSLIGLSDAGPDARPAVASGGTPLVAAWEAAAAARGGALGARPAAGAADGPPGARASAPQAIDSTATAAIAARFSAGHPIVRSMGSLTPASQSDNALPTGHVPVDSDWQQMQYRSAGKARLIPIWRN